MSVFIKIGSMSIPVIAEVELSGAPSSGDKTSAVKNAAGLINQEIFNRGVITGDSEGMNSRGTRSFDQNQVFHGGRTPLHDDSELIVTEPIEYGASDIPMKISTATLVHQSGETSIQIDSYASMQVVPNATNDQLNSLCRRYSSLSAIAFTYAGATTDPGKVKGYIVFCMVYDYRNYWDSGTVRESYTQNRAWCINLPYYNVNRNLTMSFDEEIPPEPEPDPFDPSEPEPYPPTPPTPDTSDTINIPNNPSIGVTNAGFINVYNPQAGMLNGLGDVLFPQFSTPSDVIDAIVQLYNVIANQNLINYVIDCHVIPVTPQIGISANIKVGYRDTGILAPVVTSDYIDATCGSLNIAEFFHAYQDYSATRSKLFLPFVGFVDIKPEFWQAGTISVDYKFNVIDGSFMAYVRSVSSKSALNGSVIAQYSGNACMHFPLTGVNYANMVSGIIGAAAGAVIGGNTGAFLGGAASALNKIAQGGDVQQSNGYNSTSALLSVREAFLLIERPVPAFPAGYGHNKGYPSNITTLLANVSGYTEISDIDLTGMPFTADEINELRQLLAEGVYF